MDTGPSASASINLTTSHFTFVIIIAVITSNSPFIQLTNITLPST